MNTWKIFIILCLEFIFTSENINERKGCRTIRKSNRHLHSNYSPLYRRCLNKNRQKKMKIFKDVTKYSEFLQSESQKEQKLCKIEELNNSKSQTCNILEEEKTETTEKLTLVSKTETIGIQTKVQETFKVLKIQKINEQCTCAIIKIDLKDKAIIQKDGTFANASECQSNGRKTTFSFLPCILEGLATVRFEFKIFIDNLNFKIKIDVCNHHMLLLNDSFNIEFSFSELSDLNIKSEDKINENGENPRMICLALFFVIYIEIRKHSWMCSPEYFALCFSLEKKILPNLKEACEKRSMSKENLEFMKKATICIALFSIEDPIIVCVKNKLFKELPNIFHFSSVFSDLHFYSKDYNPFYKKILIFMSVLKLFEFGLESEYYTKTMWSIICLCINANKVQNIEKIKNRNTNKIEYENKSFYRCCGSINHFLNIQIHLRMFYVCSFTSIVYQKDDENASLITSDKILFQTLFKTVYRCAFSTIKLFYYENFERLMKEKANLELIIIIYDELLSKYMKKEITKKVFSENINTLAIEQLFSILERL